MIIVYPVGQVIGEVQVSNENKKKKRSPGIIKRLLVLCVKL